jgi:hypothetical protein
MLAAPISRVDGLLRLDGSHRALDQIVEDRQRDVDQQQARDGFVDAAVLAQRARERDPEAAGQHAGDRHHEIDDQRRRPLKDERRRGRAQCAHQQSPLTADDHHAELRRQSRAQRRQNERRGARERVLPGEPGAEGALVHIEIEVGGILAEQHDKDPERDQSRENGERGDGDVFHRGADAFPVQHPLDPLGSG